MVFQKMLLFLFSRDFFSKFDKHMLLNWVTQPLTRHLFPVDFFQQVVDGKMRLVSVDDESVFEATSFTTVQADKDG